MVSGGEGWAVGAKGTILHFAGGTWQVYASPTAKDLRSVTMVSASEGWAVGDETILHYSDGAWQLFANPAGTVLTSVAMVSAGEGWSMTAGGGALHYVDGAWQPVVSLTTNPLNSVAMLSPNEGWSVGDQGTILHYTTATGWVSVSSPTSARLASVAITAGGDVYVVGGDRGYGSSGAIILRRTGGLWQQVDAPLVGVQTTYSGPLYAVSTAPGSNQAWAVGTWGYIIHQKGGGWISEWLPVGTDRNLFSVAMASASEGWAVGGWGVILHYSDGVWQAVPSPVSTPLYSVTVVPGTNEAWAVGRLWRHPALYRWALAAGRGPLLLQTQLCGYGFRR